MNHRRMLERHCFDGRHARFLMLALRVDNRHGDGRRRRFSAEQRRFARMVHAEFDDRQPVRGVQAANRRERRGQCRC